jgi:YbbR domain-containing protein
MGQLLLRRLWANFGTFLLAFALAFAVWISAVVAADPNEERPFPRAVPLEIRNQDPSLIVFGEIPSQVNLRVSAPVSLWDRLVSDTGAMKAYIDLRDLGVGEHIVSVEVESSLRPVRTVQVTPQEITITLEERASRVLPVTAILVGEPVLGFRTDTLSVAPDEVTVSGPRDLVADVAQVRAQLNIENIRESVSAQIELNAIDEEGNVLEGLTISPSSVSVHQAIVQEGGYREVAVKVETFGLPAEGYRVTSISVSPPIVTLFSNDPELVAQLPGFVSTVALDLSGAEEDIAARLALNLQQGVSVQGDQQSVEVVVGIAPIESSKQISVEIEVVGLGPGLEASISPDSVNVILSGPLSVLTSLRAGDVRMIVDLTGLSPGTHLLEPIPEILPEDVRALSISPSSVEVTITFGSN